MVAKSILFGGFEPFQEHIPLDHRGLYVDIDMTNLLGATPTDLLGPSHQELHCRNPIQNPNYKEAVHKYFSDHNVDRRHSRLCLSLTTCSLDAPLPLNIQ